MANRPPKKSPPWTRLTGVGVEYAAAVVGFAFVGVWVDAHWDIKPWGVLTGVALGLTGATYNLIRTSLAELIPPPKKTDQKSPPSSDDRRPGEEKNGRDSD
jgi:F0F1-type ATP synthase assembly protein I